MKGLIDLAKWIFSICEMIRGYPLVIKHHSNPNFSWDKSFDFLRTMGYWSEFSMTCISEKGRQLARLFCFIFCVSFCSLVNFENMGHGDMTGTHLNRDVQAKSNRRERLVNAVYLRWLLHKRPPGWKPRLCAMRPKIEDPTWCVLILRRQPEKEIVEHGVFFRLRGYSSTSYHIYVGFTQCHAATYSHGWGSCHRYLEAPACHPGRAQAAHCPRGSAGGAADGHNWDGKGGL